MNIAMRSLFFWFQISSFKFPKVVNQKQAARSIATTLPSPAGMVI
jgi:hypothetical protein